MNKEPLGREIISVNRAIFVLFISAALLFSACQQTAEQSTQATLKPLEAFRQVEEEIRKRGDELKFENDTDYFKHFARFAEEIMDQVQTENLEPEEIVWLGTFYEFCGKYQEGLAALDQ
ncbi:MAG: hypothetical protein MI702_02975, partial [Chlorobiales bacterium]|nr:hypothetical protein [Chlorobiales bacterium]